MTVITCVIVRWYETLLFIWIYENSANYKTRTVIEILICIHGLSSQTYKHLLLFVYRSVIFLPMCGKWLRVKKIFIDFTYCIITKYQLITKIKSIKKGPWKVIHPLPTPHENVHEIYGSIKIFCLQHENKFINIQQLFEIICYHFYYLINFYLILKI